MTSASRAGPPGLDLSDAPLLMGVLNVTPDSFSDGGSYAGTGEAARAALAMVQEGAALIDVGGESTRPGSDPLPEDEELARVLPVVQALASSLPGRISVDTYKARVAAQALAAGAFMVNDVSALRMDSEMVAVVRDADCPVVLMHMLGEPKTMQVERPYGDVVEDVYAFFAERLDWCVSNGLKEENLLIDPGLGFGKTTEHNLALLRGLDAFRSLGRPIVLGASRKRFLGEILGIDKASERDEATAATTVVAVCSGAHVIRVHNVAVNRDAARVARAVPGQGLSCRRKRPQNGGWDGHLHRRARGLRASRSHGRGEGAGPAPALRRPADHGRLPGRLHRRRHGHHRLHGGHRRHRRRGDNRELLLARASRADIRRGDHAQVPRG